MLCKNENAILDIIGFGFNNVVCRSGSDGNQAPNVFNWTAKLAGNKGVVVVLTFLFLFCFEVGKKFFMLMFLVLLRHSELKLSIV